MDSYNIITITFRTCVIILHLWYLLYKAECNVLFSACVMKDIVLATCDEIKRSFENFKEF